MNHPSFNTEVAHNPGENMREVMCIYHKGLKHSLVAAIETPPHADHYEVLRNWVHNQGLPPESNYQFYISVAPLIRYVPEPCLYHGKAVRLTLVDNQHTMGYTQIDGLLTVSGSLEERRVFLSGVEIEDLRRILNIVPLDSAPTMNHP